MAASLCLNAKSTRGHSSKSKRNAARGFCERHEVLPKIYALLGLTILFLGVQSPQDPLYALPTLHEAYGSDFLRIVIVEDNISLAKGMAYMLEDAGHAVDLLDDGEAADGFLRDDGADLVILDINLPGMGGLDVLGNMRKRKDARPVILLTARSEIEDRVKGLDAGADDYLVKPFEMAELAARIRALGRRQSAEQKSEQTIGALAWDPLAEQLHSADGEIELPRRELSLFSALVRAQGRVLSKSYLLDQLYGTGSDVDESVVEVYVSRLRKRLKPHGVSIQMRRGLGYSLVETAA